MDLPFDVLLYRAIIDPILAPVHHAALSMIEQNRSVIDIACGTGALSALIATKARRVVGVDLSAEMIAAANETRTKQQHDNLQFLQKDATRLDAFVPNEFDIAIISMGIHQFPSTLGHSVLQGMARISKEIIILDYHFPLPRDIKGFLVHFVEKLAGKEHNQNFRDYLHNGGIEPLVRKSNLTIKNAIRTNNRIFKIVKCRQT